jgi:hypothetical protein
LTSDSRSAQSKIDNSDRRILSNFRLPFIPLAHIG